MSESRLHHTKAASPIGPDSYPIIHDAPEEPAGLRIVGIGASAGGLEAAKKLVSALPTHSGMAFIFVQHLDPTHESMMVDLLTGHTALTVMQAAEGMPIESEHLYLIPPGTYLSVGNGALHLSEPEAPHGARLPFDFLLQSMAKEYGPRAIGVVLSGTGADGTLGLKAVKETGGLVIAQNPEEAGYDGMPRSAIDAGAVDIILPAEEIPYALMKHMHHLPITQEQASRADGSSTEVLLSEIISLVREKTSHDFALYKPGTLQRRIERRMALATLEKTDMARYLEILRSTPRELELLANDLLINVTGFFRNPKVFDLLEDKIIPDIVRDQPPDQPIRVWIVGCSTGEEAYSIAMIFCEAIVASKRDIKLQVFASDVDGDAVATAREGIYPETIEKDVSQERLFRFFTKENNRYRVLPELRRIVVFAVQDVLSDPPFSHLDLISCRNVLIYLSPKAQAKVIALFHFSLRQDGVLLLGSSETVRNNFEGRFEILSKSERLYRRIGRSQPGEFAFSMGPGMRTPPRSLQGKDASSQAAFADLCQQAVLENYAPASVLINWKFKYLYSIGPVGLYLGVPPGHPTQDLLAMAAQGLRNKLRPAIQEAGKKNARVVVAGGQRNHKNHTIPFNIDVQPVQTDGEKFFLVSFVDNPACEQKEERPIKPQDISRVAELEKELENTRAEVQEAIHNLEISNKEQIAINEEAMSTNEEFQSTNEELLTSKEELQSLNEELTALNTQLQETLERQRTTSDDLQNILNSTHVATIFLDINLNIRFFTPASTSLFSIIPGDVGRPLADLRSLAVDKALLSDAQAVLETLVPSEREIEAQNGIWFIRRIMPYRTADNRIEGVVITFVDITERKHTADLLAGAKREADIANAAKSRFLAAASHDLRQPLQTIALLQGLLVSTVKGENAQKLLLRLDDTLSAMSSMLNMLLDINQIETGVACFEKIDFPVNDLLHGLREEFSFHAQAKKLKLHILPCSLSIHSDPRLLEQMIRNLLANAVKYTKNGGILLGCRRRGETLNIEVWDTGIGILDEKLQEIFHEYHQLDNAARERSRGIGLGLSIVQRLANLLDHTVSARSRVGKGSVFAINVMRASGVGEPLLKIPTQKVEGIPRTGTILIVEDDPDVRELLEIFLRSKGHRTEAAPDHTVALDLVMQKNGRPDLILADYNLPNDMDGLRLAMKVREKFHHTIPTIILTGDISTGVLHDIAIQKCTRLNKPVNVTELSQIIQRLLENPDS